MHCQTIYSRNMAKNKYDIFISYRHEGGAQYARILQLMLEQRGYKSFLDYEELTDGIFGDHIKAALREAPIFMPVLSRGSMARCVNEDDWVRQEILMAIELGKHIVPVNPDNTFDGYPEDVPKEIKIAVSDHQRSEISFGQTLGVTIDFMIDKRLADTLGKRTTSSRKDDSYETACESLERVKRHQHFIRLLNIAGVVAALLIVLGTCWLFWKKNQEMNDLEKQRIELQEKYGSQFALKLDSYLNADQMQVLDELLGSMKSVDDTLLVSQFEFTAGWWHRITGKAVEDSEKDMPMTSISFSDIYMTLIPRLKEMTGLTFDLPSPEQWEYAAHGGQKNESTPYAGSDDVNRVAWHLDNSHGELHATNGKNELEPNSIDLFDMCGNVGEICRIASDGKIYCYGGDCNSPASEVTITSRREIDAGAADLSTGFRVMINKNLRD